MISHVVKMIIGFWMILTVLIGYIPQPEYLIELTCISNMLGGLLLLADGILGISKKEIHLNAFYLNAVVSILIVFFICLLSLTGAYQFNFSGAFFFLHTFNPVAFTLCYLFFIDEQNRTFKSVLTAPVMLMTYFLFDYMRYQLTGEFVYGFIELSDFALPIAAMAGAVLYALIFLLSLIPFILNKVLHRKRQNSN